MTPQPGGHNLKGSFWFSPVPGTVMPVKVATSLASSLGSEVVLAFPTTTSLLPVVKIPFTTEYFQERGRKCFFVI